MIDQSLFVISDDGRLSLAKDGELANYSDCYIYSANISGPNGRVSGIIERITASKKIDMPGPVLYELQHTETFSFFFYIDDSSGLLDTVHDFFTNKKYFKLKVNNALTA